jgi:hypothetical protein
MVSVRTPLEMVWSPATSTSEEEKEAFLDRRPPPTRGGGRRTVREGRLLAEAAGMMKKVA